MDPTQTLKEIRELAEKLHDSEHAIAAVLAERILDLDRKGASHG